MDFRIFNGYNYDNRSELVEFNELYGKVVFAQKKYDVWMYYVTEDWQNNLRALLRSQNDFPTCAKPDLLS